MIAATNKQQRLTRRQHAFLNAYADCGSVAESCRRAGIPYERQHYLWLGTLSANGKQAYPGYPEAFAAAKRVFKALEEERRKDAERFGEILEDELRRRALVPLRKLKFTAKGDAIEDPETGEPYVELEYDNTLAWKMLTAEKPEKYRDRSSVEHSGAVEVNARVRVVEDDDWYGNAHRSFAETDGSSDPGAAEPGTVQGTRLW